MSQGWGLYLPRKAIPRLSSYVARAGEGEWYMLLKPIHGARTHYKPLDKERALCGLDFAVRDAYLVLDPYYAVPCARCSRILKRIYEESQEEAHDN